MQEDEDVVHDIFWCHQDAVKLCNAYNLVFLIGSTYKTNRYRLLLLDFFGVTPTGMSFFAGFSYLEGLFLRHDVLPGVIITDRDLTLMNTVKTVFPECTKMLCRFHIDKNEKAKCKSLVGKKMHGIMSWKPERNEFDECLKKFEIVCSPWIMFVDYVNQTWIIPHKEKFVKAWTNKVMHLENTTTNKLLQNSLGDLCSVWEAMNNMITLQHTEIEASFETSTHVVGHVFKVTLYKKLLSMVSRYALNQIVVEYERELCQY
ncbi:hypothetical protein HKD37_10G028608 [Glycine soja]